MREVSYMVLNCGDNESLVRNGQIDFLIPVYVNGTGIVVGRRSCFTIRRYIFPRQSTA